jgi:hypothetical protein
MCKSVKATENNGEQRYKKQQKANNAIQAFGFEFSPLDLNSVEWR